jgi:cell division septum initiation protein DivIVA
MGKALLGTHVTPNSLRLLDEVRALRARVAELEQALAEAEEARETRERIIEVDPASPPAPDPPTRRRSGAVRYVSSTRAPSSGRTPMLARLGGDVPDRLATRERPAVEEACSSDP